MAAPLFQPSQFSTPPSSTQIRANLKQFQSDIAQLKRGTQQFQVDVQQLKAETQQEIANLRRHVAPIRHLGPPTRPQTTPRNSSPLNLAHQTALTQFLERGNRLWYWTSHGLIFIGTLVIGNAIVHPFEPWLRAWIHHHLGR